MKKRITFAIGVLAVLGAVGGTTLFASRAMAAGPKTAQTAKQPEPKGKVAPWEAIKIALGKVHGRPLNANFEFDEGHWVYGVMIVSNGTIQEVEVDPNTGKVGDVEKIEPAAEAKEVESELTAAIKAG